jgi:hypothetical protein
VSSREKMQALILTGEFAEIAGLAVRVEQQSRHSMIFSFEKTALRDAVRSEEGARTFATQLFDFLHGTRAPQDRFESWCDAVGSVPRRQTRGLTELRPRDMIELQSFRWVQGSDEYA